MKGEGNEVGLGVGDVGHGLRLYRLLWLRLHVWAWERGDGCFMTRCQHVAKGHPRVAAHLHTH